MLTTIKNNWDEILNFMKNEFEVGEVSFTTWLKPMRPCHVKGSTLYISATEDSRIVPIVAKKYTDLLSIAIHKVTELDVTPVFITTEEAETIQDLPDPKGRKDREGHPADFEDMIRQKGLNPKYTFSSFVSGKSNELAHAASLAVAENPGDMYKILYLYGGVGLGKTHLMHAIAIYILQHNPAAKVLYVTSEEFTNEYVDSIRNNSTYKFREKYRGLDVLLIDDIQFLVDKESTQEEFFNTFNTLYNRNKQIIITSDRNPNDINNLEDRIKSRFVWGMIADIQPPNYETRMAILRKKEELEGYNIDDEIIKYIAANIKSNIRMLEGALQKVVFKSRLEKTDITVDNAAAILKDFIQNDPGMERLTLQKIISIVAEHYQVSEEMLFSKRRNYEISYPRQVAMYLCREMTTATEDEVGEALGGRDHSTVNHGHAKIADLLPKDEKLRSEIEVLRKKILP